MILLVEDEERYREHIARVLTNAGYEVLQAADGLEALSTLEKSKIDLVISDYFNAERKWVCTRGSTPCKMAQDAGNSNDRLSF
jgi:CheY-like chemotaxis protein